MLCGHCYNGVGMALREEERGSWGWEEGAGEAAGLVERPGEERPTAPEPPGGPPEDEPVEALCEPQGQGGLRRAAEEHREGEDERRAGGGDARVGGVAGPRRPLDVVGVAADVAALEGLRGRRVGAPGVEAGEVDEAERARAQARRDERAGLVPAVADAAEARGGLVAAGVGIRRCGRLVATAQPQGLVMLRRRSGRGWVLGGGLGRGPRRQRAQVGPCVVCRLPVGRRSAGKGCLSSSAPGLRRLRRPQLIPRLLAPAQLFLDDWALHTACRRDHHTPQSVGTKHSRETRGESRRSGHSRMTGTEFMIESGRMQPESSPDPAVWA